MLAAAILGVTGTVLLLALARSLLGIAFGTLTILGTFAAVTVLAIAARAVIVRRDRALAGRWHRPLRRLTFAGLIAAVPAATAVGVLYAVTPGVSDAEARVHAQAAAHGSVNPGLPTPPKVAAALIATEDSRFYTNPGIDLPAVARAAIAWAARSRQDTGGATLEQQLATMLYTGGRSTHADQVEQAVLAIKLTQHWPKPQILQMYLATACFGSGYYGLDAAAHGYFHTTPAQLDWPQAALLAGLVQAPSAYDPVQHPALARQRRAHVLQRLAATGYLAPARARAYTTSPLELA